MGKIEIFAWPKRVGTPKLTRKREVMTKDAKENQQGRQGGRRCNKIQSGKEEGTKLRMNMSWDEGSTKRTEGNTRAAARGKKGCLQ